MLTNIKYIYILTCQIILTFDLDMQKSKSDNFLKYKHNSICTVILLMLMWLLCETQVDNPSQPKSQLKLEINPLGTGDNLNFTSPSD